MNAEKKNVYRIVAVNPGSTSTKVGYFENDKAVFVRNITHTKSELINYPTIQDQLTYRTELVVRLCRDNGIELDQVDAFVGRGGGMVSSAGGIYEINDRLIHDCEIAACGAHHPAQLASQICRKLTEKYGGWGCTCNPPDTDELTDVARPTGLKDIFRKSSFHALNQKEIAYRYARSIGKRYQELNLVIAHIGGGISVSAHRRGQVIDTNSLITGNGPMTPMRAGEIDTTKVVDMCFSGEYDRESITARLMRCGGLLDHLGTDDAREVEQMISEGDKYAKVIYDAMIYQICKYIGQMAVGVNGRVDQIVVTGGMAHSQYITEMIREYSGWISGITVMAGELELEALAAGALRAITGKEEVKTYTGKPQFRNFDYLK